MLEFSQQQNIPDPPINLTGTRNEVYKVTVSYSGANDDTACGERVSVRLPVTESLCIVARVRQLQAVIDVEFRGVYDVVERVPAVFLYTITYR